MFLHCLKNTCARERVLLKMLEESFLIGPLRREVDETQTKHKGNFITKETFPVVRMSSKAKQT